MSINGLGLGAQLQDMIAVLQMEKKEWAEMKDAESVTARGKYEDNKMDAAGLRSEAQALRGEAADVRATFQAIAAGVSTAAAIVAATVPPPAGPIIAAALAVIAAILLLIGTMIAKGLENQAAAKEEQAVQVELQAEREQEKADDAKDDAKESGEEIGALIDKYQELLEDIDQTGVKF